nr:MAG TPA: hypothetical protein [Caudoviricetes sp.]
MDSENSGFLFLRHPENFGFYCFKICILNLEIIRQIEPKARITPPFKFGN